LAVASIEDEVLAAKMQIVGVGPPSAHALVAGNTDRSAIAVLAWARHRSAEPLRVGVGIEHAESALGRPPDKSRHRVDQLIERVVAEVIVVVAAREFKEAIVLRHVLVGIADEDISIPDIWRRHREPNQRVYAWRDLAFHDAAE
jgi:hypothetical protein